MTLVKYARFIIFFLGTASLLFAGTPVRKRGGLFLRQYEAAENAIEAKLLSDEKKILTTHGGWRRDFYLEKYEVIRIWKGSKFKVGDTFSGYAHGPSKVGEINLLLPVPFTRTEEGEVEPGAVELDIYNTRGRPNTHFYQWLEFVSKAKNSKEVEARSLKFLMGKRKEIEVRCKKRPKEEKEGCLRELNVWSID